MPWMWEGVILPGKWLDLVFVSSVPQVPAAHQKIAVLTQWKWVGESTEGTRFTCWPVQCSCTTCCIDELVQFFRLCHNNKTCCNVLESSWALETWIDADLCLCSQEWGWQLWFSPSGWTSTTLSSSPGLSTISSTLSPRWVTGMSSAWHACTMDPYSLLHGEELFMPQNTH